MSQNATLVAGTRVYFTKVGENEEQELEGVRSLGRIGTTGSFVDQSTLKDEVKRYLSGMRDTEESTLRIAPYPSDEVQAAFLAGVQENSQFEFRVEYPINQEGFQLTATFEIATSGYGIPDTSDGNTILEYEVAYRMSGAPAFVFIDTTDTGDGIEDGAFK